MQGVWTKSGKTYEAAHWSNMEFICDYTKRCKKLGKLLKPWQVVTHLRVLSESFTMNTSMPGFVSVKEMDYQVKNTAY